MHLLKGKAQYAKILGKPVAKWVDTDAGQKKGDNGYEWAIDIVLDKDGLAQIKKEGMPEKKIKQGPDGPYIKFQRSEYKGGVVSDETKNEPIKVVDHHGLPWDQKKLIGNGSTINVAYAVYPGRKGNKFFITAVQVWDHVPYEAKSPFPVDTRSDASAPDQVPFEVDESDEGEVA